MYVWFRKLFLFQIWIAIKYICIWICVFGNKNYLTESFKNCKLLLCSSSMKKMTLKTWLSWFVHLELHSTRTHGMIGCGTCKGGGNRSSFSFLGLVKTCYSQLQKRTSVIPKPQKHLALQAYRNTQFFKNKIQFIGLVTCVHFIINSQTENYCKLGRVAENRFISASS